MPEMSARPHTFTSSAWGRFIKTIKEFKETGDLRYIYKNELDKTCFQYMAYGDFKDLPRRTTSVEILYEKTFNIAEVAKCDGYQRSLA